MSNFKLERKELTNIPMSAYMMAKQLEDTYMTWDSPLSNFEDMVSEVADDLVPIYTDDVWEVAKKLSPLITEAINDGDLDESEYANIEDILKQGIYYANYNMLYRNLDTLMYNKLLDEIENLINGSDEPTTAEVEGAIEGYLARNKLSSEMYLSDIKEVAEAILDSFK